MDRVFTMVKYRDNGSVHRATRVAAIRANKRHQDWVREALVNALPEDLSAQLDASDAQEVQA